MLTVDRVWNSFQNVIGLVWLMIPGWLAASCFIFLVSVAMVCIHQTCLYRDEY